MDVLFFLENIYMELISSGDASMLPDQSLPRIVSAATILSATYRDQLWVVEDILHNGATMLAGRPKIGKSWLTLQLAIAIATGKPFLSGRFRVERPGPVLYLALEDTERRLQDRLQDLDCNATNTVNIDFVCELERKLGDGGPKDGGTRLIRRLLGSRRYVAMIIDSMPAAFEPIIQRDVVRAQYAQSSVLRRLADEFEIGILVVQHLRKQASDHAVDKVSGTSGVTAGLDSILTLDGQKDRVILEVVSRETDSKPIPMKLDLAQGGWITSDAGPNTSSAREELLKCLIEHGPMQPKDIAQFLNKSRVAVRQLLRSLKQAGSVEKVESRYQTAGASQPKSCCVVSGFDETDHSSKKIN